MRNRIYAMLPGQFDRGLRQWLRQLRPPRLGAAKLIELTLQLRNRFRNRSCLFPVHDQMLLGI
jgi:hypothetical protein